MYCNGGWIETRRNGFLKRIVAHENHLPEYNDSCQRTRNRGLYYHRKIRTATWLISERNLINQKQELGKCRIYGLGTNWEDLEWFSMFMCKHKDGFYSPKMWGIEEEKWHFWTCIVSDLNKTGLDVVKLSTPVIVQTTWNEIGWWKEIKTNGKVMIYNHDICIG